MLPISALGFIINLACLPGVDGVRKASFGAFGFKKRMKTHEPKHNSMYLKEMFMRYICKIGELSTPLGLL